MTKIKFCGLTHPCDIEAVNALKPEYIGFVFAPRSKRYLSYENAARLKGLLHTDIQAIGVFVDEEPEVVAEWLNRGVIDMAQLHGNESNEDIRKIQMLAVKPIIKAIRIGAEQDIAKANESLADYVLLDSGAGTGTVFDWNFISQIRRPYFLAGGLNPHNVRTAIKSLHPYAVDVSSGIETNGVKDYNKMAAFLAAVREEGNI